MPPEEPVAPDKIPDEVLRRLVDRALAEAESVLLQPRGVDSQTRVRMRELRADLLRLDKAGQLTGDRHLTARLACSLQEEVVRATRSQGAIAAALAQYDGARTARARLGKAKRRPNQRPIDIALEKVLQRLDRRPSAKELARMVERQLTTDGHKPRKPPTERQIRYALEKPGAPALWAKI